MSKTDLGIYVHIPFCVKKCDYCDFPSGVASLDEQAYYIRILKKEIRSFEMCIRDSFNKEKDMTEEEL